MRNKSYPLKWIPVIALKPLWPEEQGSLPLSSDFFTKRGRPCCYFQEQTHEDRIQVVIHYYQAEYKRLGQCLHAVVTPSNDFCLVCKKKIETENVWSHAMRQDPAKPCYHASTRPRCTRKCRMEAKLKTVEYVEVKPATAFR